MMFPSCLARRVACALFAPGQTPGPTDTTLLPKNCRQIFEAALQKSSLLRLQACIFGGDDFCASLGLKRQPGSGAALCRHARHGAWTGGQTDRRCLSPAALHAAGWGFPKRCLAPL